MSALSEWRNKMEDAKDRLARVNNVLVKRSERVAYTRKKLTQWREKQDATGSTRAARKEAYWREQFHKAVLGKKEYQARARRLTKKIAFLKKHKPEPPKAPAEGFSTPDRPWNNLRRPVSNVLIPLIDNVWAAGWRGSVVSGYRSPAYQCEICRNMCGNCGGCPGRCAAPGASNHQRYGPGNGAVDVTNYYTFGSVARRIGSPLHNSLGAQDPVHFSFTGN